MNPQHKYQVAIYTPSSGVLYVQHKEAFRPNSERILYTSDNIFKVYNYAFVNHRLTKRKLYIWEVAALDNYLETNPKKSSAYNSYSRYRY